MTAADAASALLRFISVCIIRPLQNENEAVVIRASFVEKEVGRRRFTYLSKSEQLAMVSIESLHLKTQF